MSENKTENKTTEQKVVQFEASAPSNIALIKYMGKTNTIANIPTNSSLSYTLDHLKSYVRITFNENLKADEWKPLEREGIMSFNLSKAGQERFLRHFSNLKKNWGVTDFFTIESGNNFPAECGLASSASSFAALTKASAGIFEMINSNPEISEVELAEWSRQGSGSSCRSFFGPFSLWYPEGVRPLEFQMGPLTHQVVVVDAQHKDVSSSEAHRRVISSPLFSNRPQRAEKRLADLILALKQGDWAQACEVCWNEFWDMHSLFETSAPHFGYMTSGTMDVLNYSREFWKKHSDGPLVTMDAGANVHFLWRDDQTELARLVENEIGTKFKIIHSSQLNFS